ncbi:MAG: hypothetical protein M3R21_01140 [Candidatus Dormibacteraeota bacterium]|nr:hypothetical protein [Candidatus Dormibacteraeota bacterium]
MGASTDEINRQIGETRDHIDENLGVLEERAASKAVRYGRIAAVVIGVVSLAGVGVLIYRRINRQSRKEQLQGMFVDALKDLPETLRGLPDEVMTRLKKPLPSVKVMVNGENAAAEPGTLESIARKVAPAIVGTASSAMNGRFTRAPDAPDERPSRLITPEYN